MIKLSTFIKAFEGISFEDAYINIITGEVYYYFELNEMDEEEKEEFLYSDDIVMLPNQYELNGYDDMIVFTDSLNNETIKRDLYQSLNGKGAFRKFQDKIYYYGLKEKWFKFKNEALRKKVIKWLNDNEIEYEID